MKLITFILSLFICLGAKASQPSWITSVGDLEIVADGPEGAFVQYAKINGKLIRVYGVEHIKKSLHQVPLSGFASDDALILSNTDQLTSMAQATTQDFSWSTGPKQALVIRVDFPDVPANLTQDYVQTIMDGQVNPYFQRSSYSATSLITTVTRVYRMPHASNYYAGNTGFSRIISDSDAAASADYNFDSFDRLLIQSPHFINASGGVASTGISFVHGKSSWIGSDKFGASVIAHELGHTYGLWHASGWKVTDGNPISPAGKNAEYGDPSDIMGSENNILQQDYNPYDKHGLGWIPDAKITTVTAPGTYRVWAFDNSSALSSNRLALKIPRPSSASPNPSWDYWISIRRALKNMVHFYNGAYIQWGNFNTNFISKTYLIDLNTPGASFGDAPLSIGQTLHDPASGVSITPLDEGGTAPFQYMDIQVAFP